MFDHAAVAGDLAAAYRMHGVIEGKARAIGLTPTSSMALEATAEEVVATAAIEGERLSMDSVRSSVMRRLGLAVTGQADRHIDGLVAVIDDAMNHYARPLDEDRLCRRQSSPFPNGTSGIQRITVARYRDHDDSMQIVSGPLGSEVVHYEAPPSRDVQAKMQQSLQWFAQTAPAAQEGRASSSAPAEPFARAVIAHLWFESIYPFEDGNGRIGRAIAGMAIAQHLRQPVRLYSLSRQLLASRSGYYDCLNAAQRGGLYVTGWMGWFVHQCTTAFASASDIIDQALEKRHFWERHENSGLNARQRKALQRLLDAGDGGFEGGMNAEKYIRLTGTSKPTATRDLADMVAKGQLWTSGVGKALRYYVAVPGWTHAGVHATLVDSSAADEVVDDGEKSSADRPS